MRINISEDVFVLFPSLKLGMITINNFNKTRNVTDQFLSNSVKACEDNFSLETLSENKNISLWRQAYRSLGLKPKKTVPTAESLIKRVLKSGSVPNISPIVNAYLLTELKYGLPIGGYDLDAIESNDIELLFTSGGEKFRDLAMQEHELSENELIYKNKNTVLTRHWNYRDCYSTRIKDDSTNIVLMCEFPHGESNTFIHEVLSDIENNIMNFGNAGFSKEVLPK